METNFISLTEIEQLKKKRFSLWVFVAITVTLLAGFAVLAYCLQNRSSQRIWIVAGTIVTSLWLFMVAYVLIKMMGPLDKYLRFSRKALSKQRIVNQIKIVRIYGNVESYDGFKTLAIEGTEVDEKTRIRCRYEATTPISLKIGSTYEVETFDDVIVRIKEIS